MFELINALPGLVCQVLQADPREHRTAQMIALAAVNPTFAIADAGELFFFAMKLLDLPTMPALLLSVGRVRLSRIVGHDVVRPVR